MILENKFNINQKETKLGAKIKILVINHVKEVNLGSYEAFFHSDKHDFEIFNFSSLENPPSANKFHALWVMGGPMNVWEEDRYPWLIKEKLFIKNWVLKLEKPFFGICLGHQLLGDALGASVIKSKNPEIGFKQISLSREVSSNNLLTNFSEEMLVCKVIQQKYPICLIKQ